MNALDRAEVLGLVDETVAKGCEQRHGMCSGWRDRKDPSAMAKKPGGSTPRSHNGPFE